MLRILSLLFPFLSVHGLALCGTKLYSQGMAYRPLRRIRIALALFILGLFVSGVTAFPLVGETAWLQAIVARFGTATAMYAWVSRVHAALADTSAHYPFLAYGTDWLAFAHILFAVLFVGPYRDPVRNRWVVEFGLIACAGIFPLAMIAGPIRQIPFYWRLGDCSFGLFGGLLLLLALSDIRGLPASTCTDKNG